MQPPFSDPYNWCDRCCERCPLAAGCAVARRSAQRRWVRTMRGQDPDDIGVVVDDMTEELERAIGILEELAASEGVDLTEEIEQPPASLAVRRLERLATDYSGAVQTAIESLDEETIELFDDEVGRSVSGSTIVAAKVARISCFLLPDGSPVSNETWTADAAPNLILIEQVDADVARALERIANTSPSIEIEPFRRVRKALRREIVPFLDQIGAETRKALNRLVAQGKAPSPFCVIG